MDLCVPDQQDDREVFSRVGNLVLATQEALQLSLVHANEEPALELVTHAMLNLVGLVFEGGHLVLQAMYLLVVFGDNGI